MGQSTPQLLLGIITILGIIFVALQIAMKGFQKTFHKTVFIIACTATAIFGLAFILFSVPSVNNWFTNPPNTINSTNNGTSVTTNSGTEIPPVDDDGQDKKDSVIVPLEPNEVEHEGILTIQTLKDGKPVSFVGYSVSCAVEKSLRKFPSTNKVEVPIDECGETMINMQLNQQRWLVDQYAKPKFLTGYDLVINGKPIPTKYVLNTNNGKSADYQIILRRKGVR